MVIKSQNPFAAKRVRRIAKLSDGKYWMIFTVCLTLLMPATACGSKEKEGEAAKGNKAQGKQQEQPLDAELRQQMNMYKQIKQAEYEEAEKLRKAEKEQLKKLQKSREEVLKRQQREQSRTSSGKGGGEQSGQGQSGRSDQTGGGKSDSGDQ